MSETIRLHGGPQDGLTFEVPHLEPDLKALVMINHLDGFRLCVYLYRQDPANPYIYRYVEFIFNTDGATKEEAYEGAIALLDNPPDP